MSSGEAMPAEGQTVRCLEDDCIGRDLGEPCYHKKLHKQRKGCSFKQHPNCPDCVPCQPVPTNELTAEEAKFLLSTLLKKCVACTGEYGSKNYKCSEIVSELECQRWLETKEQIYPYILKYQWIAEEAK